MGKDYDRRDKQNYKKLPSGKWVKDEESELEYDPEVVSDRDSAVSVDSEEEALRNPEEDEK